MLCLTVMVSEKHDYHPHGLCRPMSLTPLLNMHVVQFSIAFEAHRSLVTRQPQRLHCSCTFLNKHDSTLTVLDLQNILLALIITVKIFSLCLKKILCVTAKFPVFSLSGKTVNQIPCFPCAVAILL